MQTFLLVTSIALAVSGATLDRRSERRRWHSDPVGGRHGDPFDDFCYLNRPGMQDHRRISSVTIHGCAAGEHIVQMDIGYRDNIGFGPEPLAKHGGHKAKPVKSSLTLNLERDEYFTELLITTWRTYVGKVVDTYHTRIGSIKMVTNFHRAIQCGSDFDHDPKTILAPEKAALLYFTGNSGAAIDNLQAHWIPVEDF